MNSNTQKQYNFEKLQWNNYTKALTKRFGGDVWAAYNFVQNNGHLTDPEAPRLTVFKPYISEILGRDFTETYQKIQNKQKRNEELQPYRNQQQKYKETPMFSAPSSPVLPDPYNRTNYGMHMGGRKRRQTRKITRKRRVAKKHTRKMRK